MMFKRLYFSISLSIFSFLSLSNAAPKDLWTKQFGTTEWDKANSVTTDPSGNIYVVGYINRTLPGQKSLGKGDVFVRKYDFNGKELWTQQFGTNGEDTAASVTTDPKGDIYVAGLTEGTFSGQKFLGKSDAFIRKYDTNGKEVWTKQLGTSGDDTATSVTTDPNGNIYVAGITYGTFPGQTNLGGFDAFLYKFTL